MKICFLVEQNMQIYGYVDIKMIGAMIFFKVFSDLCIKNSNLTHCGP